MNQRLIRLLNITSLSLTVTKSCYHVLSYWFLGAKKPWELYRSMVVTLTLLVAIKCSNVSTLLLFSSQYVSLGYWKSTKIHSLTHF